MGDRQRTMYIRVLRAISYVEQPYEFKPLHLQLRTTVQGDERRVVIPGAWQTYYVSRQNILQQICTDMQLPVSRVYTVSENLGEVRGYIEVAVPGENIFHYPETKPFYGEIAHSEYSAIENAAEAVLRFMRDERGVNIDDFNREELLRVKEEKAMIESFRDLFRDELLLTKNDLQTSDRALKASGFVPCAKYTDILI